MRRNCIIHIGMHKSASTSLQYALANSLSDNKFNYYNVDEDIGDISHNRSYCSLFKINPINYHGNQCLALDQSDLDNYIQSTYSKLDNNFINLPYSVTEIISGEDIGMFAREEILALKKFLDKYFYNIKVIVYLRSLESYVTSAVQELVKHGANTFDFRYADPDYKRFVEFSHVFGMENMIFRSYDDLVSNNISVVDDFFNLFDIKFKRNERTKNENTSLSLEATSFLYIYQKYSYREFGDNFVSSRNNLIFNLAKIGSTVFAFGEKLLFPFQQSNKYAIEYFRDFGIDLHGASHQKIDNNFSYTTIDSEEDLIAFAILHIDKLVCLLRTLCCSIPSFENSEHGIARLVNILDVKINGENSSRFKI